MLEFCIGGAILAVIAVVFVDVCCCIQSSKVSRREEETHGRS